MLVGNQLLEVLTFSNHDTYIKLALSSGVEAMILHPPKCWPLISSKPAAKDKIPRFPSFFEMMKLQISQRHLQAYSKTCQENNSSNYRTTRNSRVSWSFLHHITAGNIGDSIIKYLPTHSVVPWFCDCTRKLCSTGNERHIDALELEELNSLPCEK